MLDDFLFGLIGLPSFMGPCLSMSTAKAASSCSVTNRLSRAMSLEPGPTSLVTDRRSRCKRLLSNVSGTSGVSEGGSTHLVPAEACSCERMEKEKDWVKKHVDAAREWDMPSAYRCKGHQLEERRSECTPGSRESTRGTRACRRSADGRSLLAGSWWSLGGAHRRTSDMSEVGLCAKGWRGKTPRFCRLGSLLRGFRKKLSWGARGEQFLLLAVE